MSGDSPGVVVIGGDFQGVGVLRSLGRRGIRTYLVDSELSIGRFSRYRGGFSRCPLSGTSTTVGRLRSSSSHWPVRRTWRVGCSSPTAMRSCALSR